MSADSDRTAVRVAIEGRVQGVWFRAWLRREALARGLDGWVRNLKDGRVEAVLAGPAAAVETMLAACWRGPSAARVDKVTSAPEGAPVAPGFVQRDDA